MATEPTRQLTYKATPAKANREKTALAAQTSHPASRAARGTFGSFGHERTQKLLPLQLPFSAQNRYTVEAPSGKRKILRRGAGGRAPAINDPAAAPPRGKIEETAAFATS